MAHFFLEFSLLQGHISISRNSRIQGKCNTPEDVNLGNLGSEVSVSEPGSVAVQQVSVQQLVVSLGGLRGQRNSLQVRTNIRNVCDLKPGL